VGFMPKTILNQGEQKMEKAVEALKKEFALVRTGRANPAILNNVTVVYYGVPTPLNQIASISVPEAQQLLIKPFDKSIINDIEKAILTADLNLTPINDGTVIRLNFPPLTEQRRRELVKEVKNMSENAKVAIRNIRREINDNLKKLEKDGLLSEYELKRETENTQKLTDKYIALIDELTKEKEDAIMTI